MNAPVSASSLAAPQREPNFIQHYRPDAQATRDELVAGLLARAPRIAPKFLYDALGSTLFEAITELPEYYPTRTEAAILATHGTAIAEAIGSVDTLIDLGAGNCAKAARLFARLRPKRYVAVDISVDFLRESLRQLQRQHPQMDLLGLGLDFSSALELPAETALGRPLFFYPGSSIGNFTPTEALDFLRRVREQSRGGGLLIGVDLVKPTDLLEAAYDDALGVTAAFNLNLLRHLNRLIGSNFEVRDWSHVALFDSVKSRIEMHLEARRTLKIRWLGGERDIAAGERIHTENSYKYTHARFIRMLRDAGFARVEHWSDSQGWFGVFQAST